MKNLQTMKHNVQKGFTLIELMIVVAIIGILAAIAIPAYQDYTIKSRVSEGASLSGAFKTGVELYWSENGTLSGLTDNSVNPLTLGLTAVQAEYVSSVLIQVEVLLNTDTKLGPASGTCFRYVAAPSGGVGSNLEWTLTTANCTTALPAKYLPRT